MRGVSTRLVPIMKPEKLPFDFPVQVSFLSYFISRNYKKADELYDSPSLQLCINI